MTDSDDKVFQLMRDAFARNDTAHEEIKQLLSQQNGRITRLERWRTGICAVGSFIAAVFAIATKWLLGGRS